MTDLTRGDRNLQSTKINSSVTVSSGSQACLQHLFVKEPSPLKIATPLPHGSFTGVYAGTKELPLQSVDNNKWTSRLQGSPFSLQNMKQQEKVGHCSAVRQPMEHFLQEGGKPTKNTSLPSAIWTNVIFSNFCFSAEEVNIWLNYLVKQFSGQTFMSAQKEAE